MKYVKILGLLAVAAAALMAFAASASATTVTTTTGGAAATPTIHAVSEEKAVAGTTHVLLHNEAATIQCNSTTEGTVESHGSGVTAKGLLSALTFTNCTEGWTVEVVSRGSLEIHWTSGHNGTLTSSGATVKATLHLGIFGTVECNYLTANTDVGTVTGGNPATLHIEASIPKESGSALCGGGNAAWTGAYKTTSALYIAP